MYNMSLKAEGLMISLVSMPSYTFLITSTDSNAWPAKDVVKMAYGADEGDQRSPQ
jgi:hypothetical protein